jgi:hypothetical protein
MKCNVQAGGKGALHTPRMASKKQKKMAELRPLLRARGPTPRKKGAMPRPSAMTRADALASVGRLLAEHIITVLTTSSGVVAAAAAAPAVPPIMRSSTTVGCRSQGRGHSHGIALGAGGGPGEDSSERMIASMAKARPGKGITSM